MILLFVKLYFAINIFWSGVYYSDNSHKPYLNRIFGVVILMILFIPLIFISNLIEIAKDLYWKFMNFTLIKLWYYYKKGKYKNLSVGAFERCQKECLNAKYGFQKRIWQNIIDQNI